MARPQIAVNRESVMSFISKIRWPYREDTVFSLLSFIVLVVPLAFAGFTNENFETIKLVIWLIFFGLALLLWLIRKFKEQGGNKFPLKITDIIFYLLAAIVAWAFLSAIFAPDKLYSFFGFYYRFTNSFLFLLLWVLFLIVLIDASNRQKLIFLVKILCLDAFLVALKSILESFGLTLYLGTTTDAFFRASPSFLGNPNFSSMFMATLLPIILVFWHQSQKLLVRIYYLISALAIMFSLVILASRGALLALAAGAVIAIILFVFSFKKSSLKTIIPITAIFLLLAALTIAISRPAALHWNFNEDNINFRLQVWQQSATGIIHHPIFGVGLGNFSLFQERLIRPGNMGVFDDPHNEWIFLAVSGGLPLLLLFLLILGTVAKRALETLRASKDLLLVGLLSALVIFFIAASFNPVSIPCFLLLAVLLAVMLEFSKGAINIHLRVIFLWPLVIFVMLFIGSGVALAVGETALHYGYNDYLSGNYLNASKLLKFSRVLEPSNQLPATYEIYSDIKLNRHPVLITSLIKSLKQKHPSQANTYVLADNAYFNWYKLSQDPKFLDLAVNNLMQALQIDAYFPERWGELGFYYYLKGDNTTALEYLDHSLVLKPDIMSSLIVEAKIYQEKDDPGKLLAAIDQAYKYFPDDLNVGLLWRAAHRTKNLKSIPLNIIFSNR